MSKPYRFCRLAVLYAAIWLPSLAVDAFADEVQDARELFQQKQYDLALSRVDAVLSNEPKDVRARFLKGLILTEQGSAAEAIRLFTGLTVDHPELPEPYNNLAVLYAGQGEYDKARSALEKALRTHPSYATAYANLSDVYAKMASQAYGRALQQESGSAASQTRLALIEALPANHSKPPMQLAANDANPVAVKPVAVVQPTPAPLVKPATTTAPSDVSKTSGTGDRDEVLQAVKSWAAAWSSKNVKKYLAAYGPDFKTPDGESRKAWEAKRRERINKPGPIHVEVSGASVSFIDGSHASVKFRQSYRASRLKVDSSKTLLVVKAAGQWLIQEERSGK